MKECDVTRLIDDFAARQLGLVSARQLLDKGVGRDDLKRLVGKGVLARIRTGVYRTVGATLVDEHDVMAAVLACGDTAFASHQTGGFLLGASLPDVPRDATEAPKPFHITVLLERCPRPVDVALHRSGRLIERDVALVRGVPCTTAERVIVDLSGRLTKEDLGLLIDSALRHRLTTLTRIVACSERLKRAPGRSPKTLAEVLAARIPGAELNESPLEEFVYDSIVKFGLRRPTPQFWIAVDGVDYRIDHCYPDVKYALETQSKLWHAQVSDELPNVLKGNDVGIAGFKLLQFTADYTDWQIARTVARALGVPVPPRPAHEVTFKEWRTLHRV